MVYLLCMRLTLSQIRMAHTTPSLIPPWHPALYVEGCKNIWRDVGKISWPRCVPISCRSVPQREASKHLCKCVGLLMFVCWHFLHHNMAIIKWFGPPMVCQQRCATRFICTLELLLCQWHAHCVPVVLILHALEGTKHSRSKSQGENVQQDFIKWSGNSLTHGEKRPVLFLCSFWMWLTDYLECHFCACHPWFMPGMLRGFVTGIMNQCTNNDGFIWI